MIQLIITLSLELLRYQKVLPLLQSCN